MVRLSAITERRLRIRKPLTYFPLPQSSKSLPDAKGESRNAASIKTTVREDFMGKATATLAANRSAVTCRE